MLERAAARRSVAAWRHRTIRVSPPAVAIAIVIAGCGTGASRGTAGDATPAGSTAIAIASPADGLRVAARETTRGSLRVRTRVRGSARAGSVVALDASCRPRPCRARATAAADGRWAVTMTLTTPRAARFVTIDVGAATRGATPSTVTTIELVGPRHAASRSRTAPRRGTAAAPPPRPPRTLAHDVLVVGDSLAVGMADALRAALPGWKVRVDARVGRPLAEGMRVLAADRDPPAIVAFSLFTNDTPSATAALEQAVRASATRPRGCAVWATIVRPPVGGVGYGAANALLERLAGDPELALGLQLVDWRALVAQTPAFLAPDGVHGTPAGYRARGELYAAAIRACAGEA